MIQISLLEIFGLLLTLGLIIWVGYEAYIVEKDMVTNFTINCDIKYGIGNWELYDLNRTELWARLYPGQILGCRER